MKILQLYCIVLISVSTSLNAQVHSENGIKYFENVLTDTSKHVSKDSFIRSYILESGSTEFYKVQNEEVQSLLIHHYLENTCEYGYKFLGQDLGFISSDSLYMILTSNYEDSNAYCLSLSEMLYFNDSTEIAKTKLVFNQDYAEIISSYNREPYREILRYTSAAFSSKNKALFKEVLLPQIQSKKYAYKYLTYGDDFECADIIYLDKSDCLSYDYSKQFKDELFISVQKSYFIILAISRSPTLPYFQPLFTFSEYNYSDRPGENSVFETKLTKEGSAYINQVLLDMYEIPGLFRSNEIIKSSTLYLIDR